MGMFDDLICEYPLPDGSVSDERFQTKDLVCDYGTYRITRDGRLVVEGVKYEPVEEGEVERAHREQGLGYVQSQYSAGGDYRRILVDGETEVDYSGDVEFYGAGGEYLVRFENGRVEWIKTMEEVAELNLVKIEGDY